MDHVEASKRLRALVETVSTVVVGKETALERVALAIAANGHVLLEDYPGVAKTLTVKTLAQALGVPFRRVQFTPDLLPADITGSLYYDLNAQRFELRKGPVFTSFLLADEINRAPPKTQSALLEAMQEKQTTLEGETHPLPEPFLVFATQNPIEIEGTYPLPEAQLDRFLARVAIGYPAHKAEVEMLRRRDAAKTDETRVPVVMDADELRAVQRAVEDVHVDDAIKDYVVRIVQRTRIDPRLVLGASPRGSLALHRLAKAHALMRGRGFVVPDDVKAVAEPALAHRLILTGESRVRGVKPAQVVDDVLHAVPTPTPPAAPTGR